MKRVLLLMVLLLLLQECRSSSDSVTYVIGTDMFSAPFSFYQDGKPAGIDVEIFQAIAQNQKIKFEFVECAFPQIFTMLNNGEIDGIMDAITITPDREILYDFSKPYCSADIVLATSLTDPAVQSYEDLRGKAVAVLSGTTWEEYAESIKDEYGFTLLHCANMQRVYNSVITGETVACFDDKPEMKYQIAIGLPMRLIGSIGQNDGLGFLVKKGYNKELLQKFNEGLERIQADGQYQTILETYYGQ